MTFEAGFHTMYIVNILFNTSIFPIVCKKNNQSSVSNAGGEIPTLGSMDNAGNSINLVSSIICFPQVRISRSASRPTTDSIYLTLAKNQCPSISHMLFPFVKLTETTDIDKSIKHYSFGKEAGNLFSFLRQGHFL